MNSDTGELYQFKTNEALAAAQAEANQKLVRVSKKMYEDLVLFPAEQRPKLRNDLLSKNHSAKRRAKRKIAKASKQRNRR